MFEEKNAGAIAHGAVWRAESRVHNLCYAIFMILSSPFLVLVESAHGASFGYEGDAQPHMLQRGRTEAFCCYLDEFAAAAAGEAVLRKVWRRRLMSGWEMKVGPPSFWLKMKLRELVGEKRRTLTWPDGFCGRPN